MVYYKVSGRFRISLLRPVFEKASPTNGQLPVPSWIVSIERVYSSKYLLCEISCIITRNYDLFLRKLWVHGRGSN